jgi:hypothetical protein
VKSLLAKLSRRRAIGLYIGDHEVAVSHVAGTPLGPVTLAHREEKYAPDQLSAVIERLLAPLMGRRKRRRLPVAVGLPALRVFFSTRPIKTTNTEASPQVLLHEVLQSPSLCIDDMVVDLIKTDVGKRQLASIVSCRRKYVAGLLAALDECGVHPVRAEPGPFALLRAATRQHRPPRKAKTVLRILLGEAQGLAVLAAANLPIVWRFFELPHGNEAAAIISATRCVQTLSKPCGIDSAIDAVMVHGRVDLRDRQDLPEFSQQIGSRVLWSDAPGLDNSTVAFGLALGGLDQNTNAFDLAQTLKPRPSLWEIFPWGELALEGALLACMGFLLTSHSLNLNESYRAVQAENLRRDWLASTQEPQLQKEKKELQQKVGAMHKFLATRILWSSYTHDIPARLPDDAVLSSFQGLSELEFVGKKEGGVKPKKSLVLRGAAPIPKGGSMPPAIDGFIDSLRGHPLLKRDFPLVELADIKWFQPSLGVKPVARFTVACLPKVPKVGANASLGEAKGEGQAADN